VIYVWAEVDAFELLYVSKYWDDLYLGVKG